ncbi:MAG: hypothetical protein NZL90_01085 [Aquificaceae bacterium]|nr:hypothetical protein [Aquificaceae bacterium]MDW8237127.1 hypothetical protein [Aquificaceae bacterium]
MAKVAPKVFLLLSLVYFVNNLFFSEFNVFKTFQLLRASEALDKKIEQYKQENGKLKQVASAIRQYPEFYKDRFVRQFLLLQREGEEIYLLKTQER